MPSPFPGMNPWIEQEGIWLDFHHRFISLMADALAAHIRPRYLARIEEQLYLQEAPDLPRRLISRADVGIMPGGESIQPGPSVALLEAPTQLILPRLGEEAQAYLTIRDRSSREVVTVLELLSPTNKVRHRDQYLLKREQLLGSTAHLVEIDLLRGGDPLPPDRPDCDYSVLVSRSERRPRVDFWPIALRDPLPIIPIPLRAPDRDATLELQPLIHQIYDAGQYAQDIYGEGPHPPLRPEDREWARGYLPAEG